MNFWHLSTLPPSVYVLTLSFQGFFILAFFSLQATFCRLYLWVQIYVKQLPTSCRDARTLTQSYLHCGVHIHVRLWLAEASLPRAYLCEDRIPRSTENRQNRDKYNFTLEDRWTSSDTPSHVRPRPGNLAKSFLWDPPRISYERCCCEGSIVGSLVALLKGEMYISEWAFVGIENTLCFNVSSREQNSPNLFQDQAFKFPLSIPVIFSVNLTLLPTYYYIFIFLQKHCK